MEKKRLVVLFLVLILIISATVIFFYTREPEIEEPEFNYSEHIESHIEKGGMLLGKDDELCRTEEDITKNQDLCGELLYKFALFFNDKSYCERPGLRQDVKSFCLTLLDENIRQCENMDEDLLITCNLAKTVYFEGDINLNNAPEFLERSAERYMADLNEDEVLEDAVSNEYLESTEERFKVDRINDAYMTVAALKKDKSYCKKIIKTTERRYFEEVGECLIFSNTITTTDLNVSHYMRGAYQAEIENRSVDLSILEQYLE